MANDRLMYDYLTGIAERCYAEREESIVAALQSHRSMKARKDAIMRGYLDVLGPFPDRTPLNPQTTGSTECGDYSIENVLYESRPNHHVTANLYIPTDGHPPYPGVLVLCGHTLEGKVAPMYQKLSILLAKNGFTTLTVDPICQGERLQFLNPDGRPHFYGKPGGNIAHTPAGIGALLVGTSTVAYELWDNVRSIDYLLSRPETDASKQVGCTGTSGGGTQTVFLMAFDERIGPAAPSCYTGQRRMLDLGPSDLCQHLPREGEMGTEHADYMLMHAPAPVLVLAGARDQFFSVEASKTAYLDAKRMYRALGYENRVDFFVSDSEHGMTQPHREAVVAWMNKWLKGEPDRAKGPVDRAVSENGLELEVQEERTLRATKSGQVTREWDNELTVAQLNLQRATALGAERKRFWNDHAKHEALAEIRRLAGIGKPSRALKWESSRIARRSGYDIEKITITREGEVPVPGLLFVPRAQGNGNKSQKRPAVVYVDDRGKDTDAGPDGPIERLVAGGNIVLSIDVRGFGETTYFRPHPRRETTTEQRESAGHNWNAMMSLHIGRPLLGQRVADVLAAVDYLAGPADADPAEIRIAGIGRCGPVVLHAAALDERIREATIHDSIVSWIDDVVAKPLTHLDLTNVVASALTKYDLPDLVEAIKPRAVKYK